MEIQVANIQGILLVKLVGRLDFESLTPFRRSCLERLSLERVVFDLAGLLFVGSVGLTEFVDVLKALEQTGASFLLTGQGPEFRRLFDANGLATRVTADSIERAIHCLLNPSPLDATNLAPVRGL